MAGYALAIEPDQQMRLEAVAITQTCSPELLLREALESYLQVAEDQVRLQIEFPPSAEIERQITVDAEASWKHYQLTGLHVSHDEVLDWFDRLRDDSQAPPPECHT